MDYQTFIRHTCRLENRHDMVTVNTPPGPLYRPRLWLRRWTMSSDTDQLCKMYLKSDYALRLDRKKHYNLYFWTIHPLSDAMAFCEKVYVLLYLAWLANCPFTLDVRHVRATPVYLNFVLDLLFLGDVALRFFSGFPVPRRKDIVLDRRDIARHYLLSYFAVDFVSSLPWHMLFYLLQDNNYYVGCVRAVRLVRSITIVKLVGVQQVRHGWSDLAYKMITMLLLLFFILWGSATTFLAITYREFASSVITKLHPHYIEMLFLRILHKTTMVIVLVDIGYEQDPDVVEALSPLCMVTCHIIGFILQLVILTMLMMIVSSMKGTEYHFKLLKREVEGYCDFKKIPPTIRDRLQTYYDFKYQRKFYDELDIKNVLTHNLQNEFHVASVRRLVETVDLFAELSVTTLVEICLAFKLVYILRNDLLSERGQQCENMYVIATGTVALYDADQKEVCHLEDGCCLGELALLFNVEMNMPTVVALSPCEVYALRKYDFEALMRRHDEELTRMHELAQEKLQRTLHVMQTQGYAFIPPQVVVEECMEKWDL